MKTEIPQRILSGRVFAGQSAATRERNLAALARFSDPRAIRNALLEARDAGYGAVMTLNDERVVAAMKSLRAAGNRFEILPIVPNVLGMVREATEHGLAGAGLRRLMRVGAVGFARAALVGAMHPGRVLAKHFPTLLAILYELEMGEMTRFDPPAVFLHHQMTDLALALGNRTVFEDFARLMRERFGAEPGLATSNFALLTQRLEEWRVPISLIAAPLNREGFLMPEGAESYGRALASGAFRLIADRVSVDSPTPSEAVEWALARPGVVAVVAEETMERP
ncbi:hypothetical protein JW916_04415 [Candidatus Sumerlaeota bacterium]|nr:hypothetical protein [Candidatus Sumerlaeota bacterium]